eukprot:scaffold15957_cov27-Phaeocystis_antarctica.AAC.1
MDTRGALKRNEQSQRTCLKSDCRSHSRGAQRPEVASAQPHPMAAIAPPAAAPIVVTVVAAPMAATIHVHFLAGSQM